jgi:Domain of unknown function (DUF6438)
MTTRTEFTALLKLTVVTFVFAAIGSVAAAQSIPLSEVEVRLVRTPHGGCAEPCSRYSVTVRGDGTVRYDGSVIYPGTGQVDGVRTRSTSVDEVIALVNEFLKFRFFDALATYREGRGLLVRKGDMVELYGSVGGSDDPQADLTLRIGNRTKTVTLYNNYPTELGRLPELVDRIGGPRVWP